MKPRWRDAPKDYGPHKTIYNRFIRWSELGVFSTGYLAELAWAKVQSLSDRLMIDATHLKLRASHRRQPAQKGAVPRRIRAHEGRLELQAFTAVCDGEWTPAGDAAQRRPDERLLTGRRLMLDALPPAKTLLGDRGYDAGWFRNVFAERGIVPCNPAENRTAKYRSLTTGHSTTSATRSRTCSAGSRTGDASIPATTAAPTPFLSHLYRSNQSSFGSNE